MPGSTPVLSAELSVLPLEDSRFLVYAPLRQSAFVTNARVVNFLVGLREGRFAPADDPEGALVAFLRGLDIVDAGKEIPPVTEYSGVPEPTSATLFLTTACNLRCTYCYASAGDAPAKFMSLATACRAIDFVSRNAQARCLGRFDLAYHGGGEPSVNWRVLTESLEYAHRRAAGLGLRAGASITTNGVLSPSQIEWVANNMEFVTVSFDGLPEVHDRSRLTVLGSGSSGLVLRTLRRFDEHGVRYGVRMTVPADQVQSLADSVEFV